MTRRACNKKSPFKPDRTHLHHILVHHGFDGKKPVTILLFLCAVLNSAGILGVVFHIAEPLLFGVFVTYFIMNWNADFLVGKLVKIIDVFQRKEKPQNCPTVVHSFFRRLRANRFFRGSVRHDVELELVYHSFSSDLALHGIIINLSKTGFLAQVDGFGPVCTECVVEILFPGEEEPKIIEMPVEHLWMSPEGGTQYHGFRFLDLSVEQGEVLKGYLEGR
jgi:hypothetical protein